MDANVRVTANYPAVNAVVLMLQKDCDWSDPRRCRTKLPRLHRLPDRNWRTFFRATREKLSHIAHCDWQGPIVTGFVAPNLVWGVETGKFFLRLSLINFPSDPPTKNTCNTHT